MYSHRPDTFSLTFGLLFTVVGLLFLAGVQTWLLTSLLIGLLGLAAGIGVIGSLVFGDVHKRAGRRLATRAAATSADIEHLTPPSAMDPRMFGTTEVNDPLFGHPIDPDELDQAYRDTFGDSDPLQQTRAGQDDNGTATDI